MSESLTEAKARSLVSYRANGRCELCNRQGQLTFAHRRNRSHQGAWAASNGLALCGSGTTGCHGWTEQNPTHAATGGWRIVHSDTPATEVPVWLPRPWPGWWLLDDDGCFQWLDVDTPRPADLPPWAATSGSLHR
jgi:hypothetical protein